MMTVGRALAKIIHSKIQKEHVGVTGIINRKGKSAKFREEVKWSLKYQFIRI